METMAAIGSLMVEISRLTGLWFFTVDSHLLAPRREQVSEIALRASLQSTQCSRQVDLVLRPISALRRPFKSPGLMKAIGSLTTACKSRRIIESQTVKHKRKPGTENRESAQLACTSEPARPTLKHPSLQGYPQTDSAVKLCSLWVYASPCTDGSLAKIRSYP